MTATDDLQPVLSGERIRLRTLILLRWTAAIGQSAALLVAWHRFDIDIHLWPSLIAVGVLMAANLAIMALYPARRRLSESEALAMLVLDTVQLVVLLGLTGGMHNPFALLVLAPVTIAATALRSRQTVALGALTVVLVTALAIWAPPMALRDGGVIAMPAEVAFGHWLAVVIGVVFLGLYARRVAVEMQAMEQALFATQLALSREQRLCDLGGVVAAAAHELGTPLATIKLASAELASDLRRVAPDHPDLAQDAALIRSEADRCSAILRDMGRIGRDDLHLRHAPLAALLAEAAEPHQARRAGITVSFQEHGDGGLIVQRMPELIHGLRNLIQNAVDFARGHVWIDSDWTDSQLRLRITDDGPGFPPQILSQIGYPFLGQRRGSERPGYDGMGLGLFIAKTLLERSGARLRFANAADPFLTDAENQGRTGAVVELVWPRNRIEAAPPPGGLGRNPSMPE
ncbi:sensor histidine kinase RegB [Paracoccus sp. p4-l81]|uniref:sensor histidine kinase RegB n=1 Tax=unclassified Paracoccus (in: a-proteobacteria) TaxID=2688777 RepID=UPI0035BB16AE